jgi:hypothetical protein
VQPVMDSQDGFIAFDNETVVCELLRHSGPT